MSFSRLFSKYRNRLSRILGVTSCALSLVGVAVVGSGSFPSTATLAEDNVNGYVSVSGDYFDLHMYGDTTFTLSTEEWSFYNILGMGNGSTSNYDFSIGNYHLYGGTMRFGFDNVTLDDVSLNFSFYTPQTFPTTNAQVYLQVYCSKEGLETKYVIANGVFHPSHPDYQPNAGQNIVGHFEYVNGFQGTFTIKEDTSKVLNDTNIRFLTTMWTDFTLGEMPTYLNGSIGNDYVVYPLVSVNDVSALNLPWRVAPPVSNPDPNTYVSATGYDWGMVLFPFQVKYVLEDDEWSIDTIWFIEVLADLADLVGNDWFYRLPFAVEYDVTNARFVLFGNPNFCPGVTIDGAFKYFTSMTASVETSSYAIVDYFVPATAPYREFGYNVSVYNLDKYLKFIAVDTYWTAYWAGWNNGRVELANAVLSGSAYDQGYKDGQKAGLAEGYSKGQRDKTSTVFSLFGAVVSVPIDIFNGLTPLVIWDTPIISIVLTFVFIGVFLFILKRFI